MPEGDTIRKLAVALVPGLEGQVLREGRVAVDPRLDLAGCRVEGIDAHGKHLFISFDSGEVLRSHLGMYGSWHRYVQGEEWRRPAHQASIVLATEVAVFVCFNAREVELLRKAGVSRRLLRSRLGLDLITAEIEGKDLVARVRQMLAPDEPLADLLLDQRIACGIGNVCKSEVLFLEGLAPERALASVDADRLIGLFVCAHHLLRSNLQGGARVTRPRTDGRGRLWVYGRHGRPCLCCGVPVRCTRLGRHWRSTWWCPRCQR
jgi:endonuclease-8